MLTRSPRSALTIRRRWQHQRIGLLSISGVPVNLNVRSRQYFAHVRAMNDLHLASGSRKGLFTVRDNTCIHMLKINYGTTEETIICETAY
jgi:hypothetical protein